KGYCVDYEISSKDFDGRFEFKGRAGEVSLDPNSNLSNKVVFNNILISSNVIPDEGIVHQINDNNGDLFKLGNIIGTQKWVVKDEFESNKPVLVSENYYALLATQKTGVLALQLHEISSDYSFSPNNIY